MDEETRRAVEFLTEVTVEPDPIPQGGKVSRADLEALVSFLLKIQLRATALGVVLKQFGYPVPQGTRQLLQDAESNPQIADALFQKGTNAARCEQEWQADFPAICDFVEASSARRLQALPAALDASLRRGTRLLDEVRREQNTTPVPQLPKSEFKGGVVWLLCVLLPYLFLGTFIGMGELPSPAGSVVWAIVVGGFISLGWFMIFGQQGGRLMPAFIQDSRNPFLGLGFCLVAFIAFTYVSIRGGVKIKLANDNIARERLAGFRKAVDQYLSDNKRYPETLDALAAHGKYLLAIPKVFVPVWAPKVSDRKYSDTRFSHETSSAIYYGAKPNDAGGWMFNSVFDDPDYGSLRINCTHTDLSGKAWASY